MNRKIVSKSFKASLATSLLIASFWSIYYLSVGEVPNTINLVPVTSVYSWDLPFGESRWYDALIIGPVWMSSFVLLFYQVKVRMTFELIPIWGYLGIVSGFLASFGLFAGLNQFSLISSFLAGMTFGYLLFWSHWTNIATFILFAGFVTALICGWAYGIFLTIPLAISMALVIILLHFCKIIILTDYKPLILYVGKFFKGRDQPKDQGLVPK